MVILCYSQQTLKNIQHPFQFWDSSVPDLDESATFAGRNQEYEWFPVDSVDIPFNQPIIIHTSWLSELKSSIGCLNPNFRWLNQLNSIFSLCFGVLLRGFQCLYAPGPAPECNGAPIDLYYDSAWHGVASREGFTDTGCRTADFGNACYNDHHYHFSYWD